MSFNGLLNQTVQVYAEGTVRDKQGRLTPGSATTYPARVERTAEVAVMPNKEMVPIDAVMYIASGATIKEGVKVTYGDDEFKVMRYTEVVGRNGRVHHYEVKAQKWSS